MAHAPEPKNFEPKEPVKLNPPKEDPISVTQLAECNGKQVSMGFWIHSRQSLALHFRNLCL